MDIRGRLKPRCAHVNDTSVSCGSQGPPSLQVCVAHGLSVVDSWKSLKPVLCVCNAGQVRARSSSTIVSSENETCRTRCHLCYRALFQSASIFHDTFWLLPVNVSRYATAPLPPRVLMTAMPSTH